MSPSPRTFFPFLAALLAAPLAAQEQQPSIEELERRIELLAGQVDELKAGRVDTRPGEVQADGLGPAAAQVYAGSGLSIGGYGEVVSSFLGDGGASTDMLRAVLYVGYAFDETWVFNSEVEFEHGDEVGVEFAYLDGRFHEAANLRVGHLLVPMGFVNELHEPTTFWSVDRPTTERWVLPSTWHENGIGTYGAAGDFSWRAYLMNGFDAEGFDLSGDGLRGGRQKGSRAAADRAAVVARADWEGVPGLLLGGSAYQGDSGQDGAASDFATSVYELHAQYEQGPWRFRGLWAEGKVDDAALLTTPAATGDLGGWYLEGGYDLFAGPEGEALIPYLRYESVDLQDGVPGGDLDLITVGLAWQPRTELIFKLDVQRREDDAGLDDTVLQFGIGWIF